MRAYDKMSDKQKRHIDIQADMSAMQAGFSNLAIDNKMYAWSNATALERDELKNIYNNALNSHRENNLDSMDDIIDFNKKVDEAEIRK
jgi:hypothetical protein